MSSRLSIMSGRHGAARQGGFSMIEVLAAVVIFSIGLAGMAGMSLASLRSAADGQFNSQATFIADELADTMRANLTAYETANFVNTPAGIEKVCAPDSKCTAVEQAQYDSGKWQSHALAALPGGQAIICMDSSPNDGSPQAPACDGLGLNTIKIFWQDSRNNDALAEGETFHRYALAIVP